MQLLFLSTYHSKPQHAQWKGKLCDWNWENKYGISSFAEHSIHIEKNDKWVPPVILKESDFRFLISYYASDKLIIVSLPEKL